VPDGPVPVPRSSNVLAPVGLVADFAPPGFVPDGPVPALLESLGARWIRSSRSRVLRSSTGQCSCRRRCNNSLAGELTRLCGCRDGRRAMVFGGEQSFVFARGALVLEL